MLLSWDPSALPTIRKGISVIHKSAANIKDRQSLTSAGSFLGLVVLLVVGLAGPVDAASSGQGSGYGTAGVCRYTTAVGVTSVNIRKGPSRFTDDVGDLLQGQTINGPCTVVVGNSDGCANGRWTQVWHGGTTRYICSAFLRQI